MSGPRETDNGEFKSLMNHEIRTLLERKAFVKCVGTQRHRCLENEEHQRRDGYGGEPPREIKTTTYALRILEIQY